MLDPVTDPVYNIREVCKQCVLLEDHLAQARKRCPDCIRKHLFSIEGLTEEAISLDKNGVLPSSLSLDGVSVDFDVLPEYIRGCERSWKRGDGFLTVQQKIRALRKALQPLAAEWEAGRSNAMSWAGENPHWQREKTKAQVVQSSPVPVPQANPVPFPPHETDCGCDSCEVDWLAKAASLI